MNDKEVPLISTSVDRSSFVSACSDKEVPLISTSVDLSCDKSREALIRRFL